MADAPSNRSLDLLLSRMFQAHPWHGVSAGEHAPESVTCYVEIVPTDAVKYELDKHSGQLRLDRPQRYSSLCPTLYGFIPQTYCADRVARRCVDRHQCGTRGDGDPLDLCVLSEKSFTHGDFVLKARPIGGLRMIDGDEADDKIVAVLESDVAYGELTDIDQVPRGLLDRLRHYFLTYKQLPDQPRQVRIAEVYDRAEALEVIRASFDDYREAYGDPALRLEALRRLLSSS